MAKEIVKILLKPETRMKNEVWNVTSMRRQMGGEYSYDSSKITITVLKDGAITFSMGDGEHFVYFYPDQLKHLTAAVRLANKTAKAQGANP